MDCKIIETMRWYDWASTWLLLILGTWKLVDLVRAAGKWAEKKCEAERKARYDDLLSRLDKSNNETP